MNLRFLNILFSIAFIILGCISVSAQTNFPIPSESNRRLFYVQRSTNSNTIIYDANLLADKSINTEKPIDAYWIMYENGGKRKDLSFIQRKLAYGVEVTPSLKKDQYDFNIVSYPKKKLKLVKDPISGVCALMSIGGKTGKLKKVFVQVDPAGAFSLSPDIKYVEIFGTDYFTGQPLYEKIIL